MCVWVIEYYFNLQTVETFIWNFIKKITEKSLWLMVIKLHGLCIYNLRNNWVHSFLQRREVSVVIFHMNTIHIFTLKKLWIYHGEYFVVIRDYSKSFEIIVLNSWIHMIWIDANKILNIIITSNNFSYPCNPPACSLENTYYIIL